MFQEEGQEALLPHIKADLHNQQAPQAQPLGADAASSSKVVDLPCPTWLHTSTYHYLRNGWGRRKILHILQLLV